MNAEIDSQCWLVGCDTVMAVDLRDGQPVIQYWGPKVADDPRLQALWQQPEAPASVHSAPLMAWVPQAGFGFPGIASLKVHRDGAAMGTAATLSGVERSGDSMLVLQSRCDTTQIELTHRVSLDSASDVLTASVELRNVGDDSLWVDELPALCLPIDPTWSVTGVDGRWALEFQTTEVAPFSGAWVRENRSGRSSHHTPPMVYVHEQSAREHAGSVLGLHLAWSGNHRMVVEALPDGRRYVSLAPLFLPGEMRLAPGESVQTPTVNAARSSVGFGGMAEAFHAYCRRHVLRPEMRAAPRPVHFNTWEALYFNVSEDTLPELIDQAADLGVERFVLDDGWFVGRHDDTAALGDWQVDRKKFPSGLGPVADRVIARGMQFGLWVEPEMVNPDSALFRAHPEWAQGFPGIPRILARNQLVLDLSNRNVQRYLLDAIDELLTAYPIRYLKWDMNRDLTQPGDADGRAVAHAHSLALYELLATLRVRHPEVEIESCSSGGGRADYGVLRHTDRIWTSDSNDAIDRLAIQRGFSRVFPPEVMGSHVGPFECHITGRRLSMSFRAGVAMLGHMGVEADIRALAATERDELAAAISVYKRHRVWMHDGRTVHLETPPCAYGQSIIARDGAQAIVLYAMVGSPRTPVPAPLRLVGLDPNARYRLSRLWPQTGAEPEPVLPPIGEFRGDALMHMGLPVPVMKPETLWVLHLERSDPA